MRQTTAVLVGLVLVGCLARFLPHPPNFTPVIAATLLAGAFGTSWTTRLALPLLAMWVGDVVINNTLYAAYFDSAQYFGDPGVYVAIGAVALLPRVLGVARDAPASPLFATGVGGAVLFYLLSNTAVWMGGALYGPGLAGWAAALTAGLPFLTATVASTLVYGAAGVAMMRFAQRGRLRPATVSSKL